MYSERVCLGLGPGEDRSAEKNVYVYLPVEVNRKSRTMSPEGSEGRTGVVQIELLTFLGG